MIALIAACSENWVIGMNGRIPWKIKGEQQLFKELTTGNAVIIGRRSFEEIGRPLPNRKTIVVSNTLTEEIGCPVAGSLKDAIAASGISDIYISGGERLYKEGILLADKIYLTRIHKEIEGDAFFPQFGEEEFERIWEEPHNGEVPFTYFCYQRK